MGLPTKSEGFHIFFITFSIMYLTNRNRNKVKGYILISSIMQYPLINLGSFFILLTARVPKDWIYPVLVTQARYVAPDISGVSKRRVNAVISHNGK